MPHRDVHLWEARRTAFLGDAVRRAWPGGWLLSLRYLPCKGIVSQRSSPICSLVAGQARTKCRYRAGDGLQAPPEGEAMSHRPQSTTYHAAARPPFGVLSSCWVLGILNRPPPPPSGTMQSAGSHWAHGDGVYFRGCQA